MGWMEWVKNGLLAASVLCVLTGMALTFAAMFDTKWQIADFGGGNVHYHGLWKDCETNSKVIIKNTNGWICNFKFDATNQQTAHPLQSWQLATMALLGTACILALIALILSCLTCCIKFCSIGWVIASFLMTLASGSGLFVFFRWSQDTTNRVEINENIERAAQTFGLSFYLAVGGCMLFLLSTIFSGFCAALIFYASKNQHSNKTWPKHQMHNTVV